MLARGIKISGDNSDKGEPNLNNEVDIVIAKLEANEELHNLVRLLGTELKGVPESQKMACVELFANLLYMEIRGQERKLGFLNHG